VAEVRIHYDGGILKKVYGEKKMEIGSIETQINKGNGNKI